MQESLKFLVFFFAVVSKNNNNGLSCGIKESLPDLLRRQETIGSSLEPLIIYGLTYGSQKPVMVRQWYPRTICGQIYGFKGESFMVQHITYIWSLQRFEYI